MLNIPSVHKRMLNNIPSVQKWMLNNIQSIRKWMLKVVCWIHVNVISLCLYTICLLTLSLLEKDLSHNLHLYVFCPECVAICLLRFDAFVKSCKQTEHWPCCALMSDLCCPLVPDPCWPLMSDPCCPLLSDPCCPLVSNNGYGSSMFSSCWLGFILASGTIQKFQSVHCFNNPFFSLIDIHSVLIFSVVSLFHSHNGTWFWLVTSHNGTWFWLVTSHNSVWFWLVTSHNGIWFWLATNHNGTCFWLATVVFMYC